MYIPTTCPSCSSKLERVKDQLFCRSSDCPAQNSKIVENFCKKMKIKGFGEKTIAKLELASIADIYSLNLTVAAAIIGDKVAEKLISEVDAKRTVDFGTFIGALGIPLIGGVAGKKIASVVSGWKNLEDAVTVLGTGSKALESLLKWKQSEIGLETMLVPVTFNEQVKQASPSFSGFPQGNVVITGKLDDYKNRGEAATYLESLGYSVKPSVTAKTNYLIVEDGSTSSKTQKANDLNIPILTIKELIGE
jgi:NAD-dependent DNA ligase